MESNERLAAFETMLRQIETDFAAERRQMEALKAAGKEKTATYRQFMGNRLVYQRMLELYRQHGLTGQ